VGVGPTPGPGLNGRVAVVGVSFPGVAYTFSYVFKEVGCSYRNRRNVDNIAKRI
jgi:hypothetical protein